MTTLSLAGPRTPTGGAGGTVVLPAKRFLAHDLFSWHCQSMTTCRVCKEDKQDSDYYVSDRTRCKSCALLYSKQWQTAHKERKNEQNRRWRAKNSERYRTMTNAGNLIWRALQAGLLIRATECEKCHTSSGMIEAAHTDYTKPLEVLWLCRKCHRTWDSVESKTCNCVARLNEIIAAHKQGLAQLALVTDCD